MYCVLIYGGAGIIGTALLILLIYLLEDEMSATQQAKARRRQKGRLIRMASKGKGK